MDKPVHDGVERVARSGQSRPKRSEPKSANHEFHSVAEATRNPADTQSPFDGAVRGVSQIVRTIVERQRTMGNRAVGRLLQAPLLQTVLTGTHDGPVLQAKLNIGAADSPLEHEADQVAEQVMRVPSDDRSSAVAPLPISRKCAACDEEERALQTKLGRTPEVGTQEVPLLVQEALRSPGQTLAPVVRAFFEPRFGRDFGRVRVHTNHDAAESARAVGALAYTVGNDIVFDAGRFTPNTHSGRRLIAHELAHVVQQSSAESHQGRPGIVSAVPVLGAGPASLARQAVNASAGGLPMPSGVEVVVLSCSSNDISFFTNQGVFRYPLTICDLSDGEYDATVSSKGKDISFDLGASAREGVRFRFQYKVTAGQTDPSEFFGTQRQVRLVARTTGAGLPTHSSIARLPVQDYVDAYSDVVYDPDYNKQGTALSTWLRVRYADGTAIDINIYNLEDKKMSSLDARDAMAQGYVGKGGRIFPLRMNAQTTPRLWGAREAAIEEMEKSNIEFMSLSLAAVMIVITMPGMPAGMAPESGGASPRANVRRVPKGQMGALPPAEEGVAPAAGNAAGKQSPKASGRIESGGPGNKPASAKALAENEASAAPRTPLPADQQKIAESLVNEHPGLNPKVAADAAKGGASAAGKGGAGADVPLLNGGGREVSVHQATSPFTADSIGSHLQTEAMQKGTSEVYLQINSGTREGFLKILPEIRNAYLELRGVFVQIFGPDGSVWWRGTFGGPK